MKPQGTEGQSSVTGSPASSSTSLVPVPRPASAASVSADCGPSQLRSSPSTPQPPCLWAEALPEEDQEWVVKALFRTGAKGKLELQENLKLWYDPPQPNNVYHQVPSPDRFFAHPLLVWMPYRLWKVKVVCPNPSCGGHQLTGAGLHNRARRVLDIDRIYNMVTETLTCGKCKASHLSWSQVVLQQLDLAHRSEFRVILTQKYACDLRVIRLLRERGLGNSPTLVLKQLMENHTEEWLHRVGRYTTECVSFLQRPGLLPVVFSEPPEPAIVPSCKWLLSVYIQDILTRLEDVKAHITSIYGTILKMNSTKKITKKLAGTAEGTALWLTSVGNEYGQILISVLTAQEEAGLDEMADGLVSRYAQAGEDPPVALYVDSGCCVEAAETTKPQARFSGWPDLLVRLDVWDFMRRLALGCTSNAHQLYPLFMSRLSACIFEWDAADLALLREAKAQQLQAQGLSSVDVDKHLTRKEFALHCRRRTRGEETTVRLLEKLLSSLMGSRGNNFHGVPLFDQERMEHIWRVQKRHVKCIQDPPGVALYTKTGELTKGGVRLPVLRCARGSASLESFYLHMNRFIPETSASLNFQAYLLEGLHRWNQDRAVAALTTEAFSPCCYSSELLHSVNCKYEKLFGSKLAPEFCPPSPYTGELIGVQYLYQQTGQALQDMNPDTEETAKLVEEQYVAADEDERFSDLTDDPTIQWDPQVHGTSSSMPVYDTSSSTLVRDTTSTLGDTSSSPACDTVSSTLAPEPKAEAEDESIAVDDQNVPGCQHVDRLAEYLVALGDLKSLRLSNQQASQIIELWNSLDEGDKKQVIYAARHQERVLRSRFGTPKQPSKRPGVESTTRCVLGETSAPAQWPDCCVLVENMFIRLCALYPGPRRKGKRAESRWTLILRHYRKIRELVVGNARVMQGTDIRLAEVNQNTLIQWHQKRQKKQKLSALLQGAALPPVVPVSEEPLPEPRALPAEPPAAQQEHRYRLPGNTAGQAKQRETPRPIVPKGTVKRPLFVAKPTAPAVPAAPAAPIVPARLIIGTAQPVLLYRYVFPEKAGATPKRPYRRTVEANTCKKCGQFRTAETGHSQFRGRVYCPNFEAITKQQWLEEMRRRFQK